MREREDELSNRNINVVVVTFEAGFLARQYVAETGRGWPLLVDKDRQVYHAYGMLGAGFWDVWGASTWIAYGKEFLHGRLPPKSSGDIRQRGGDVLIDPQGVVRLQHVGSGPADSPRVESILQVLGGRPSSS